MRWSSLRVLNEPIHSVGHADISNQHWIFIRYKCFMLFDAFRFLCPGGYRKIAQSRVPGTSSQNCTLQSVPGLPWEGGAHTAGGASRRCFKRVSPPSTALRRSAAPPQPSPRPSGEGPPRPLSALRLLGERRASTRRSPGSRRCRRACPATRSPRSSSRRSSGGSRASASTR